MDSHINPSHGGNSSSLDSLKPSVFATIIILVITLIISVSICFLLRCLNRCNHHSPLSPSSSDSVRFSTHRVSPETERSSVLDSLPIFKFSSVTRRSTSTNSSDCAVCLSNFEPEDQLRLLPLCCHAFHAACIDTWLASNQTCPLCRSPLFASDSDLTKALGGGEGDNSFRLEIGSISRRDNPIPESDGQHRSYSIGSFDYIVDDVESEISESNFNQTRKQEDAPATATAVAVTASSYNPSAFEASLAGEIGNEGSRSWLKDYVDRLSHGISFRSSDRFFTGSSRRSEEMTVMDLEANHAGEEISELFRWFSGM
ncbi:E3 ubiquitin-protein ligase ATL4-like [Brassica napus]|uniref:RING-type E3 ubiquitin transferase n=1 Tax=Brassica oleracea var. oleracea TaxID=109376 RepID=A0A0D3DUJ4_BRAOL|nr:PREDICTED: E3 ubiquitin-protein ligase ATL4-like [Brassica oleracea var. oleracea]XP_013710078.1 E3 ubiquitin-protein ligase ATL4-like [Brassica napus]